MKLNPAFYDDILAIEWFSRCGLEENLGSDVQQVHSIDSALTHLKSDFWADVKTVAQGELTVYLSRKYPSEYFYWNDIARGCHATLSQMLGVKLDEAIESAGFPLDIRQMVIWDITGAAIEKTYRSRFKRIPTFFEQLLEIYAMGHLPCGWEGRLEIWRYGRLICY